ncbi:MAG: hypothetical protein KY439_00170, partial [Actinobacteria bacterium]|nr:hypothetical protein [Actinomycetota bacterium]
MLEERREARDGAGARATVAAPLRAAPGIPGTARPPGRRNLIVRVDATTPDTAVGQGANAPPRRLA